MSEEKLNALIKRIEEKLEEDDPRITELEKKLEIKYENETGHALYHKDKLEPRIEKLENLMILRSEEPRGEVLQAGLVLLEKELAELKASSASHTEFDYKCDSFGHTFMNNRCKYCGIDVNTWKYQKRPPDATGIVVEKEDLEWLFHALESYMKTSTLWHKVDADEIKNLKEKYLEEDKLNSSPGGKT